MRENVPTGNRLATFLDALMGQFGASGHVGDLGTDRKHHPAPNSELVGRLFQGLTMETAEMAYGTYTNPAIAVAWDVDNLGFRPELVLVINSDTAALVAHVRGMDADSEVACTAAAAYVTPNGITLTAEGFEVPAANASMMIATDVLYWIAVGFGGPAA